MDPLVDPLVDLMVAQSARSDDVKRLDVCSPWEVCEELCGLARAWCCVAACVLCRALLVRLVGGLFRKSCMQRRLPCHASDVRCCGESGGRGGTLGGGCNDRRALLLAWLSSWRGGADALTLRGVRCCRDAIHRWGVVRERHRPCPLMSCPHTETSMNGRYRLIGIYYHLLMCC
mmetsp:Transcript_9284/g.20908  ORF Transcript_9284/g.20908 Transcript_9284/m.20908 type:complete len:174 (-) Transcript_9284:264-785(-)